MKVTAKLEGFAELDKALAELREATSSRTGKATMRKALVEAGEPIAEDARRLAPVDTGELRDSIRVGTKIRDGGKGAYADVMRAGGSKADAVQALRDARRAGAPSEVNVHIGPSGPAGSRAHLVEFGSVNNAARPFMRPAWEGGKDRVIQDLKGALGKHITAAAKRAARRKGKSK
mgnify:CR=1 FL=1